jgi:DNA-directed RNA polymerase specialized sigma54-like protein
MEDSSMWMDIGDDFNNMIDSFDISIESSPQMDFYQVSAPTPVSFGNNTNMNTSPNFTPITNSPPSFYVPPGYEASFVNSWHTLTSRYQPNNQNQNQITVKNEFDEEYLVTLDSDTFQDYVQQIRKRRSLTRNEEQIVKRLVKKIKNRESARKSRQAKKEISQELDEQVVKLTEQAQSLKLVCNIIRKYFDDTYFDRNSPPFMQQINKLKMKLVLVKNLLHLIPSFLSFMLRPSEETRFKTT